MVKIFFKPIFIFLFFLLFYYGTSRVHVSTETIAATYLPISLIRGNGFDLEKIYPAINKFFPRDLNKKTTPYYIIYKNNHYFSVKPVFSSLLAVPIYFPAVILKGINFENLDQNALLIASLGKISAAAFAAVSVSFVYLSAKLFLKK